MYAAYIDYVAGGGLFISTHKKYSLDGDVFMLLNLMDEADRIPVEGKVIWITPIEAAVLRTVFYLKVYYVYRFTLPFRPC
ncbi:MAG: hypothetical protein A6F72_00280 [Cycloclasticus sp. symbiont of Poecilosclerida sp. N]|nr:MAG: hypothetical protein A6F72_00280 [Cycloclasticus sp. symbiont of Poecilosclerida sp. N]